MAKRDEIIQRLRDIGADIREKYRVASGIDHIMDRCGFSGNHAKRIWEWIDNENDIHLPQLEVKTIVIAEEIATKELEEKAKKDKIKDKESSLEDRFNALIEHLGLDK